MAVFGAGWVWDDGPRAAVARLRCESYSLHVAPSPLRFLSFHSTACQFLYEYSADFISDEFENEYPEVTLSNFRKEIVLMNEFKT